MYTEFLLQALSLIGGLAFFLYGMNVMGDGLTRLSGGRLERILEKLTDNRIKAVLLGAGVTAVIQSSSATTVTVVGFVNSGIMKLNQAIGVIMGANIGTTVTSWILSLTGIEGNNLLVTLLKPTSFTPILAIIGIFLIMASKQEKRKDIGAIMIGFAILMFGMDTMSAAVKPLADVPQFTHILTMFSNPILGMLAGAILTAIIQSSSASVGILQALCLTGSVPYATAIPIIMGQNIGTCVTALLSSIGAGKNAKRAALVHLYFNVIGTTVFMIVFYSLYAFIDFSFMHDAAGVAGIAVIHSLFNIGATILLFPFANMLEKLATLTIREDEEETTSEFARLDSRFLDSPALALEQCERSANEMAYLTLENVTLAPIKLKKMPQKEAEDAALDLLRRVGIEDKASVYPSTLSGGQKQRIAIVRSLCMNPEIILFDEVTAALDPEMVREVLDVILGLAKDGMTMLIVTHEMNFARQVANRIVFMDKGQIIEQAKPEDFFTNPTTDRAKTFLNILNYEPRGTNYEENI